MEFARCWQNSEALFTVGFPFCPFVEAKRHPEVLERLCSGSEDCLRSDPYNKHCSSYMCCSYSRFTWPCVTFELRTAASGSLEIQRPSRYWRGSMLICAFLQPWGTLLLTTTLSSKTWHVCLACVIKLDQSHQITPNRTKTWAHVSLLSTWAILQVKVLLTVYWVDLSCGGESLWLK